MVDLITREYFEMMPIGIKKQGMPYSESINEFISVASEQVEAYCERKFAQQEHVEIVYGSGSNMLLLDQYPVQSITSITYEDNYGGPFTVDIPAVILHPSGRLNWKFPVTQGPWRQDRVYTITYVAGYDPVPGPVRHATALWVTELMRPNFMGPSPERPAELVPLSSEQIVDLLENYRRRRIG